MARNIPERKCSSVIFLYLVIDNRTLLLRITAKISLQLNSTIVGRFCCLLHCELFLKR